MSEAAYADSRRSEEWAATEEKRGEQEPEDPTYLIKWPSTACPKGKRGLLVSHVITL